jgi:hypothetical protein
MTILAAHLELTCMKLVGKRYGLFWSVPDIQNIVPDTKVAHCEHT